MFLQEKEEDSSPPFLKKKGQRDRETDRQTRPHGQEAEKEGGPF